MNTEKIRIVTLTLTQSCNLRCKYCYEENRTAQTMIYEAATRIIAEELNKNSVFEEVEFDLFGGEPFLEFDLIKRIVKLPNM